MGSKLYSNKNVYDAALERLYYVFLNFPRVYISFSGGKDSGVLLNLALHVAKNLNRLPVNVLTIDFEAQYKHTIDYVYKMMNRKDVNGYWVCLLIHLRNAVSQIQPHWLCWDENKKDAWIREMPDHPSVINDRDDFPLFSEGMEFEEFVPKFGEWFSKEEKTACLVGIRSDESINRFRTIKNLSKETYEDKLWSTRISENVWNFYPI